MKINYNAVGWENDPSAKTPLSAENLNIMEQGTINAINEVNKAFQNAEIEYDLEGRPINLMLESTNGSVMRVDITKLGGEGGASAGFLKLGNPSDVSVVYNNAAIEIKWTDPRSIKLDNAYLAEWDGTIVVRKEGSAPASSKDGIVVLDNKIKNKYAEIPYRDADLISGKTYYYGIFPYTKDKVYTLTTIERADYLYSLDKPANILVVNNNGKSVSISWTDPDDVVNEGVLMAEWDGTIVVRKEGSAPRDAADGTIIVNSVIRNEYVEASLVDENVELEKTYYYGIFPYTTDGIYNTNSVTSVLTEQIYPDAIDDLSVSTDGTKATLTFTVPDGVTRTRIVYKEGSAPENDIDGNVINNVDSPCEVDIDVVKEYYFVIYAYNEKNNYSVSNVSKVQVIGRWTDGTWKEIEAMLRAHYRGDINISRYWKVGDARNIDISETGEAHILDKYYTYEKHSAQTIPFVITGYDYYDKSESYTGDIRKKTAVTVQAVNCLKLESNARYQVYNGSYDRGLGAMEGLCDPLHSTAWANCKRREWLNDVFYKALPDELQALICTSSIRTCSKPGSNQSYDVSTTHDKIFLPAEHEVISDTLHSNVYETTGAYTYEYYRGNMPKNPSWSTGVQYTAFWTRSVSKDDPYEFCCIFNNESRSFPSIEPYGIAPAFSL